MVFFLSMGPDAHFRKLMIKRPTKFRTPRMVMDATWAGCVQVYPRLLLPPISLRMRGRFWRKVREAMAWLMRRVSSHGCNNFERSKRTG